MCAVLAELLKEYVNSQNSAAPRNHGGDEGNVWEVLQQIMEMNWMKRWVMKERATVERGRISGVEELPKWVFQKGCKDAAG